MSRLWLLVFVLLGVMVMNLVAGVIRAIHGDGGAYLAGTTVGLALGWAFMAVVVEASGGIANREGDKR